MGKQDSAPRQVLIEGYSDLEILALPIEQVRELVLTGEPVVFRIGSATVLAQFRATEQRLHIELAQIQGDGEGVLLVLGSLARRFADLNGLRGIEWVVHAVHCSDPNLKLRRVLELRGFVVSTHDGVAAYRFVEILDPH